MTIPFAIGLAFFTFAAFLVLWLLIVELLGRFGRKLDPYEKYLDEVANEVVKRRLSR